MVEKIAQLMSHWVVVRHYTNCLNWLLLKHLVELVYSIFEIASGDKHLAAGLSVR